MIVKFQENIYITSGYIPYWFDVKITNDEKNTNENIFHVW